MSGDISTKGQTGDEGTASKPRPGARGTRQVTLLMLVAVDFFVAAMMVGSCVRFVLEPDTSVKAGPMYVTLALTTGGALLMFFIALNASFLPLVTRQHARDLQLVMWSMMATGIVTGILTLGQAVEGIVARLFLGTLAFVFIWVQEARLHRARASGALPQADPPGRAAAQPSQHLKTRQRRGGRKR